MSSAHIAPQGALASYAGDLARLVGERWKCASYDHRAFPDIAESTLQRCGVASSISIDDVVEHLQASYEICVQSDPGSHFGQPALTLYNGETFSIELLFWRDGTTKIHQHAFAGAFGVVSGSSLHTKYRFEEEDRVSEWLKLGHLHTVASETLAAGNVRPIAAGADGLVHSVFHLDDPTISIVVRTHSAPDPGPQFTYWAPHVAFFTRPRRDHLRKRLQFGRLLTGLEDGRCLDYFERLVGEQDFESTFHVLSEASTSLQPMAFAALIDAATVRHGRRVDLCIKSLKETSRRAMVASLRREVADPDTRFFLGALACSSTRREVLDLMSTRRKGDDPVASVADAIARMGTTSVGGLSIDASGMAVVRAMLRDLSGEALLVDLSRTYGRASVQSQTPIILELSDRVRRSELFRPLFSDSVAPV